MKKPVATSDVKAIAAYYMIEKAKELLHEPAQPCSRAASGSAALVEMIGRLRRIIIEHHSSTVMREEICECPICVEKENAATLAKSCEITAQPNEKMKHGGKI